MEFSLELPVRDGATRPDAVVAVAQAAERAGFSLLGYTDHPAPSGKWLGAGGHPTLDPFAALCFVAAVTSRVRLMTYLAVLPYRNPLLLAKSVATVDQLSAGRFTLVAGTGYLRSEFAALGASFEDRNARFDEAIDVLRSVYTDDDFRREGAEFNALGVCHDPKPVQLPHPPIWVGGSSRASRRRVARFGAGWAPLAVDPMAAGPVRTAPLAGDDRLASAIDELRGFLSDEGRDPMGVSIQLDGAVLMDQPTDALLERTAELAALGVTHLLVRPTDGPAGQMADQLEQFGHDVIQPSE
jgi:probable F420-dependent oxidoreductase